MGLCPCGSVGLVLMLSLWVETRRAARAVLWNCNAISGLRLPVELLAEGTVGWLVPELTSGCNQQVTITCRRRGCHRARWRGAAGRVWIGASWGTAGKRGQGPSPLPAPERAHKARTTSMGALGGRQPCRGEVGAAGAVLGDALPDTGGKKPHCHPLCPSLLAN